MFGSKRRKAVQTTVERIRPVIAVIQHHFGLPAGFWQDDFVIGFFGFLIGFHMNITFGFSLSQTEKGLALTEAFTALSNMNGVVLARRFVELTTVSTSDFERGADNAALIAYFSIGQLKNETENEHVREARAMAEKIGAGNNRGDIAGMLMLNLFVKEVEERF
jgi:hypothetical protein